MRQLPGQKSIEICADRNGRYYAKTIEQLINFPVTIYDTTYWEDRDLLVKTMTELGFFVIEEE